MKDDFYKQIIVDLIITISMFSIFSAICFQKNFLDVDMLLKGIIFIFILIPVNHLILNPCTNRGSTVLLSIMVAFSLLVTAASIVINCFFPDILNIKLIASL